MLMRSLRKIASCALLLTGSAVHAQVVTSGDGWQATLESYANATAAACFGDDADGCRAQDGRLDAALRALVRSRFANGPDIGVRVVIESSPGDRLDLAEASLLVFGDGGRFEVGDRPGLPDVLTGYAPNSFTFTSADFGPASGPSLDPGGGLQAAFLPSAAGNVVRELGVLGFAASLFDDRSTKALYVSPRANGFLGGVSYAQDADDGRFGELLQSGLVHESYWRQNVLRIGGSWTHALGRGETRDLDSVNAGVTLVIDDSLTLGLSGTWNGTSGLERAGPYHSDAGGWVASVNYNTGPWTLGGFLQQARGEGDARRAGDDRLDAVEVGLSWRYSTRLRLYAAWYAARIEDEGTRLPAGNLLLVGVRITL
jgi:Gram-negative porin